MAPPDDDTRDWTIRQHIYQHIVDHERPPTAEATAAAFGISPDAAQAAYDRLHNRHAIFLDPVTRTIRMANPFSTIPSPFRVQAHGHAYWANCAWDALGIPAALHSDATIEMVCAASGQPITLAIADGRAQGQHAVIHFLLPFKQWYEDLIHT